MPGQKSPVYIVAIIFTLLLWTEGASAYIGPGAGMEPLAGYFVALLAWILTAFAAVLTWPIYSLIRWIRGVKDEKPVENATATEAAETPAEGNAGAANAGEQPVPVPSQPASGAEHGGSESRAAAGTLRESDITAR